jgi:hypothetical protein
MIHLFNANKAEKRSFPGSPVHNSDDLFEFIKNMENAKLSEDHPEFGSFSWSFKVFNPRRTFELYHNIKEESLTPAIRQAYEKQLDLLEMYKGDLHSPIQIPIISDIDVKYLQKIWCFEYCRAHGYGISEDFYRPDNTNRLLVAEKNGGDYADF